VTVEAKPKVAVETVEPKAQTATAEAKPQVVVETVAPKVTATTVEAKPQVIAETVEETVKPKVSTPTVEVKPQVAAEAVEPKVPTATVEPKAPVIVEARATTIEQPTAVVETKETIVKPRTPQAVVEHNAKVSAEHDEPTAPRELHAIDSTPAIPSPLRDITAIQPGVTIEINPEAASARTSELVEVASAIADTIRITPAIVRGDGEVAIHLKPTVLDGSEIHLEAKGSTITVAIAPATPSVAAIIEQSTAQLAERLVERMPSFQFAISIASLPNNVRKSTSNETD
jgi:hypothetical protein